MDRFNRTKLCLKPISRTKMNKTTRYSFYLLSSVFILILITSLVHSSTNLIVQVDYKEDLSSAATYCDLPTSGNCNVRSAWLKCLSSVTANDQCTIKLPFSETIHFNTTRGNLFSNSTINIVIEGNSALIKAYDLSQNSFIVYHPIPHTNVSSTLRISDLILNGFGNKLIDGGTIRINGTCALNLTNVTITNSVGFYGGALYIRFKHEYFVIVQFILFMLMRFLFSDNVVSSFIFGCVFSNNHAHSGGAMFIAHQVSNVLIRESTVSHCSAELDGCVN